MPRIRTLKPEIWGSPQVMALRHVDRLLFIGLITQADDMGRGSANPMKIKAAIFPCDEMSPTEIEEGLDRVLDQGLITLYDTADRGCVYSITSWRRHQRIDRPKPSFFPDPPADRRSVVDQSSSDRRSVDGDQGSRIGSDLDQGSRIRVEGRGLEREERGTKSPEVLRGEEIGTRKGKTREKGLTMFKHLLDDKGQSSDEALAEVIRQGFPVTARDVGLDTSVRAAS